MTTEISRDLVRMSDLQNVELTLITYSDGTKTLMLGNLAYDGIPVTTAAPLPIAQMTALNPVDDKISPQLLVGVAYADQKGCWSDQVFASAAFTANHFSAEYINVNWRGCKVTTVIATPGTGSLTVILQRYDSGSATWITMLSSTALTTAVTSVLSIYPGITAAANINLSDVIPDRIRVLFQHNNANTMTYSAGISFNI